MSSKLNILVVEDDEIELLKFKMVTGTLGLVHQFEYATDGERAIDYLRDKNKALPQLILLDLNMPRFDGLEFLSMMRTCLLYTSPSPRDATLSRMPSSA